MTTQPPHAAEIIDMWKTKGSQNFSYFNKVEPKAERFWIEQSRYRRFFNQMNHDTVVEIACGKGRHTAIAAPLCGTIWATDTSVDAIEECKARFKDTPNVRVALVSGDSGLAMIDSGSITAVFSYDAMVHFEMLTVASYLAEISRILRQRGRALLHHSNYGENPEGKFTDNPGWRNFMTMDIMRYLASRNNLKVVKHRIMNWKAPKTDALTLLERL